MEAAQNALGVPPRGFLPIIGDCLTVTKPTIAAVNGVTYACGWLFAQMTCAWPPSTPPLASPRLGSTAACRRGQRGL